MGAWQPTVVQIAASSVAVDDVIVTTIVALLDNGQIMFTDATVGAEWHTLPPLPNIKGRSSK